MKRSILGALMVVGFLADSAFASCDDTIYLTKIQVHRQLLKNAKALGTWTVTEVDPWDNTSILNAGPILKSIAGESGKIRHALRLAPDCGPDSISPVIYSEIRDSVFVSKGTVKHQSIASRTEVATKTTFTGEIGYTLEGDLVKYLFTNTWNAGELIVGLPKGETEIEAYQVDYRQDVYSTTKANYIWSRKKEIFPFDNLLAEDFLTGLLRDASGAVDSVGKGVDSVVSEFAYFRYVYSYSAPASASVRKVNHLNPEKIQTISGQMEIMLAVPQSVSIVSPSGRVVRRLDAARNVVWDLRDQAGVRVQPGVWFVQVQGLKTVPVVVR
ncbi:MAG: hypothetical protein IPK50_12150 [Fibrobacterota bacterium]|nr:hypothetical protein [Fibrobacterota bacterium]QQS03065.1 MAG: hypothetical protein IPK50_12150 [Fibrobacterota bacterium]